MFDNTLGRGQKSTKVKIDFIDQTGSKYSLTVEDPSKENIVKVMDFIQMISPPSTETDMQYTDTNFNRVYTLLEQKFPFGSFTSTDVMKACQEELGMSTPLSTISTYLSRMAERGLLIRNRNGAGWIYHMRKREQGVEPNNPAANFIPR